MSTPDDPEARESVWARLEREDREDAERNARPSLLGRTAILWILVPILAEPLGRSLPHRGSWACSCLAVVQLLIGGLWYRSDRRRP